jgi:hypothetical protein
MTKNTLWWARTTVGWHPAETADQVILLPETDARTALAWWDVQFCTTWSEVAAVSPDLEEGIRERADGLDWEDDDFNFRELPGVEDGDLPPPPWSIMADRLPADLVAAFAVIDDTVLNGSFVRFPGDRVDAILAWCADRGIATEEHPELGRVLQDPGVGAG